MASFGQQVGEKINLKVWADELNDHLSVDLEIVSKQGTKFCLQTTLAYQGESQIETKCEEADSYMSRESMKQILAYCESILQGELVNVIDPNTSSNVPACKVANQQIGLVKSLIGKSNLNLNNFVNSGFVWLGEFPILGAYRINDGNRDVSQLTSYSW